MDKVQLIQYRTGLTTCTRDLFQPSPPFSGAGWRAELLPQRPNFPSLGEGLEVVISAKTLATARCAYDLILGCHDLITGEKDDFGTHMGISIYPNTNTGELDEENRLITEIRTAKHYPLACSVAAKASRKSCIVYAIAKYEFSISIFYLGREDLEPSLAEYIPITANHRDLIYLIHAIIAAYSAIEDLGLEIRASNRKPSRINGRWNPIVKTELEKRLTDAKIDLNQTVLWTVRGPKRKIEASRIIPPIQKFPWSKGEVRDIEIDLIEAIAFSDWLRDCVASHKIRSLTKSLSVYDAINVQHLTRHLILDKLGYWKYIKSYHRALAKYYYEGIISPPESE